MKGKRVGGQIVPVEEWLDQVKRKWDLEKPVATEDDKPEPEEALKGDDAAQ